MRFGKIAWLMAGLGLALMMGLIPDVQAGATGSIQVTVIALNNDKTQEPAIGATVQLSDANKQFPSQVLATNERGQVLFPMVPVGSAYAIYVTYPEYQAPLQQGIRVAGGQTTLVTIKMMETIKTDVVVIGKEKVVDMAAAAKGSTKISAEEFTDMPVMGRNYQSILTTAPGVQDTDGDGNPTVHGSRSTDFSMSVNGVSNQDPLTGGYQNNINQDAIEEIEIVDSGASAEYGGAVGGFGKIITKSGGNKFEGSFQLTVRDSIFDNSGAVGGDPVAYQLRQGALFFSGPILRDKLWFAVSHEYVRFGQPFTVVGGDSVLLRYNEQKIDDKITWQVNPKNKLQFEYQANPWDYSPGGVDDAQTPAESGIYQEGKGPTYTAKWVAPFNPTLIWEATVGVSKNEISAIPYVRNSPNDCVSSIPSGPGRDASYLSKYFCTNKIRDSRNSGSFNQDYWDKRQRNTYEMVVDKFVDKWLGVSHKFKFGIRLERTEFERDVTVRPTLELESSDSGLDPNSGAYLLFANSFHFPGQHSFKVSELLMPKRGRDTSLGNDYSAYVMDVFEPLPNLSINVGLRLSHEELTSDGYQPVNPTAERAQYDTAIRACITEACANCQELGTCSYCASVCLNNHQRWFENFTVHPLDDPRMTIFSGETLPNCAYSLNPQTCDEMRNIMMVNNDFAFRVRQTETFSVGSNGVEPRLFASWDPANDGKTKVTTGWARVYGFNILNPLVSENGPDFLLTMYSLNTQKQPMAGDFVDGILPKDNAAQAGNATAFSVNTIARDLRMPFVDEWSLGVEREIAQETAIKIKYLNRHYRDQLQTHDINRKPIDDSDIYLSANPGACQKIKGFWDCTGIATRSNPQGIPDGIPDLKIINPFFNRIGEISNSNNSQYSAFMFMLERRYYQNWEMNVSYVYSKNRGQAGAYNSGLGSDPTAEDMVAGWSSDDIRHSFKLFGRAYVPKWGGFRIGGFATYNSGLPYSIIEARQVADLPADMTGGMGSQLGFSNVYRPLVSRRIVYPTGQRNDQRNAGSWNLDLQFEKEFMIKRVKTTLQLGMFNVLNDKPIRIIQVQRFRNSEDPEKYWDVPFSFTETGRMLQIALKLNFS